MNLRVLTCPSYFGDSPKLTTLDVVNHDMLVFSWNRSL